VNDDNPLTSTLTRNIRQRRGSTVCICVPLFVDKNTDKNIGLKSPCGDSNHKLLTNPCCSPTQFFHPKTGVLIKEESQKCNIHKENATQPVIYMDAMAFGMGNCCIQCTFLARDIKESRILYDQLIPICPIMLAITASTPIVRGLLADTDVRWNIIAASVDDRTPEEQKIISKSRYDSCSLYIGPSEEAKRNSDLDIKIDPWSYKTLIEAGIDERLATHVAHLFIRDPLVIYPDCEKIDDKTQSEHFENIQSTNWQTCRFKPPPASSSLGWRVEFRVMEVQLTDFENAALAVFSLLLTRVILSYRLRFYMPISKVDLNMAKAHKKDAVLTEKFYFRTNITDEKQAQIELLTVNEIMNGSEKFVGLIPLMHKYLDSMNVDISKRKILNKYIDLVSKRASGKLMTTAKYLRNFVLNHPGYKQDSVITEEIAYDLVDHAEKITNGQLRPKELLN
jgi:glutamate--cysteine ligase catalytic subunit